MASYSAYENDSVESPNYETAANDLKTLWTAARCQRLLRPLSSKIALLRREKRCNANAEEIEQVQSLSFGTSSKHQGRSSDQGTRRRTTDAVDIADEDWAPNPRPRKKLKRTYSSKSLTCQHTSPSIQPSECQEHNQPSAEITIPDNFFQSNIQPGVELKAAGLSQNIDLGQRDHICASKAQSRRSGEHPRFLWPNPSRSNYNIKLPFQRRLTDGIAKGLEALLKTTGKQKASRERGARGLFATCLRKVPDFIAQEELWSRTEDPESDVDISFTIYSDLESLSTSQDGGWMPLRQIVRAHGISMVGSAICDGIIEAQVARGIVATCCRVGAYDEAQQILQCLSQTLAPSQKTSKVALEAAPIFQALDEFVTATGRHSVRYRLLISLIGSGRLPLEWIGRPDMIDTWNRVVQSITQHDDDAGPAAALLRLVTHMTYGVCGPCPATLIQGIRLQRHGLAQKANGYIVGLGYETRWPRGSRDAAAIPSERDMYSEKASTTISSLMTVLCAIGLLRSAGEASNPRRFCLSDMAALQDIATDAQQVSELVSNRVLSIQCERMMNPLLAAGLVQATLCRSHEDFAATVPALFERLSNLHKVESITDEGGSFLCAVAECCARATGDEVFDHTQKVVQHIRQIAETLKPLSGSHELCNRIGLAAALEYAETTKHPKHLHWALDVEQAITGAHLESTRRTPAKTPLRGQTQSRNGYRWEAGICEWVAKTPAMDLARPWIQEKRAVCTQNFSESPVRGQQEVGGKNIVFSPCWSTRASKEGSVMKFIRRVNKGGLIRSVETAGVTRRVERSPRKVFFSHVNIADDGDELSRCESSAESPIQPRNRLGDITNLATRSDKQGGIKDTDMLYSGSGTDVHEMTLESEDELSFL
ncbi:MAG: hypothetical protein Q9186_001612 [Xanthomendoza sp. 1 TL-2023]